MANGKGRGWSQGERLEPIGTAYSQWEGVWLREGAWLNGGEGLEPMGGGVKEGGVVKGKGRGLWGRGWG